MRSKSPSSSAYPQPLCKRGRFHTEPSLHFSSMSGEPTRDEASPMETSPSKAEQPAEDVVKKEEEKLKAKYPQTAQQGAHVGHAAFIQKRLAKGQKFFDSGDYNMYKQGAGKQLFGNKPRATPTVPNQLIAAPPTGAAIPTPETVPARKTSIIQQPKFQSTASSSS